MSISKIKDGKLYPYSEQELRKEYPNVSFPKGLGGVDLSIYDCVEGATSPLNEGPGTTLAAPSLVRIPMHMFLYGIREFGLRVQLEVYILGQEGHARDYWLTAPYVVKGSTYIQHMAETFQLSDSDLDAIWSTASGIEE
jgi:hypothetical protein